MLAGGLAVPAGDVGVSGKRGDGAGHFYVPTVLTGVREDMLAMHEETFGPVAPLMKFDTEQEVIRLANATEFGLASYFYSRDVGRVWRVAEALESGIVGINEGIISTETAPFGGVKASGLGHEGGYRSIDFYTDQQAVHITLGAVHTPRFGVAS